MRWRVDAAHRMLAMLGADPAFAGVALTGDLADGVLTDQVTIADITGELRIPRFGHSPVAVVDQYLISFFVRCHGRGKTRAETMERCGDLTQAFVRVLSSEPTLDPAAMTPMGFATQVIGEGFSCLGPDYMALEDGSGWVSSSILTVALSTQSPC